MAYFFWFFFLPFLELKKNHISWLMYQFHYMHGTRGSALNWTCTLYHQYSGIVTLIKKYDFFSEILLSKSDENWKFQIKPASLNISNMHWKHILEGQLPCETIRMFKVGSGSIREKKWLIRIQWVYPDPQSGKNCLHMNSFVTGPFSSYTFFSNPKKKKKKR